MTLIDVHPRNPLRPIDWRWRRSGHLHLTGMKPHRRRDDGWTRVAIRLRERLDLTVVGRRGRIASDAAVDEAHRLAVDPDPRNRWQVEARFLAGQSPVEIADLVGLAADSIEAFGAIFFDIADKLSASDFIAAQVFGARAYSGFTAVDVDLVMKIIGYNLGPLAVDALVRHLGWPGAARLPAVPDGVAARTGRAIDVLISAMTLDVDGPGGLYTLRLNTLVDDLERAAARRSFAPIATPIGLVGGPPVAVTSPGVPAGDPAAVDREPIVDVPPASISRRGPARGGSPLAAVGQARPPGSMSNRIA